MKPVDPATLPTIWPERERLWARELGRLHLGVEPIPEQVAKYRRVTIVLSLVAAGIGSIILALFLAFRSPIAGLVVSFSLFGPMILSAWLGQWKMESRAKQYLRERAEALAES